MARLDYSLCIYTVAYCYSRVSQARLHPSAAYTYVCMCTCSCPPGRWRCVTVPHWRTWLGERSTVTVHVAAWHRMRRRLHAYAVRLPHACSCVCTKGGARQQSFEQRVAEVQTRPGDAQAIDPRAWHVGLQDGARGVAGSAAGGRSPLAIQAAALHAQAAALHVRAVPRLRLASISRVPSVCLQLSRCAARSPNPPTIPAVIACTCGWQTRVAR